MNLGPLGTYKNRGNCFKRLSRGKTNLAETGRLSIDFVSHSQRRRPRPQRPGGEKNASSNSGISVIASYV